MSKKDWTEAAEREIGAGHSLDKLIHPVEGIDILPFYDASDLPESAEFQLASSQNEVREPRSWSNQPRIQVIDPVSANRSALDCLNAGADGILFELIDDIDPAVLLKDIELSYCQTCFLADTRHENFAEGFAALVNRKKIKKSQIEGAIFWKGTLSDPGSVIKWFKGWEKFHPLGIVSVNASSVSEELASLLAKAVIQIEASSNRGSVAESIQAIAFMSHTQKDFFLEIARLKILRSLFLQVCRGFDPSSTHEAHIHALSDFQSNATYDPHSSLIASTLEGLSAILGGCNAMTVISAEQARIALNISSLLKEEGHLGKVADPTAGSYFLENLQDKLALQTWKKFQAKIK